MKRLAVLAVPLVLLAAACSHEKASDNVVDVTTSTSSSTSSSTTSTTAFVGATTPTSAVSHATSTALLTDVRVEDGLVTFVFRGDQLPGYDVKYVEPPITEDASGKTVDVKGSAFLRVRMEPASGVDMNSGSANPEQTYTGPDRIAGLGAIAELVRTGDFEANLSWVIGLDAQRAYRVEAVASMIRVYFSK